MITSLSLLKRNLEIPKIKHYGRNIIFSLKIFKNLYFHFQIFTNMNVISFSNICKLQLLLINCQLFISIYYKYF